MVSQKSFELFLLLRSSAFCDVERALGDENRDKKPLGACRARLINTEEKAHVSDLDFVSSNARLMSRRYAARSLSKRPRFTSRKSKTRAYRKRDFSDLRNIAARDRDLEIAILLSLFFSRLE